MHKIRFNLIFLKPARTKVLIFLITLFLNTSAYSQLAIKEKQEAGNIAEMRAPELNVWLRQQIVELTAALQNSKTRGAALPRIKALQDIVIGQLRADKYVSDNSVELIVNGTRTIESELQREIKIKQYPLTHQLIEESLLLLPERSQIQAGLHLKNADIYKIEGNHQKSQEEYAKSVPLFAKLNMENFVQQIEAIFNQAEELEQLAVDTRQDNPQKAEQYGLEAQSLYLQALSFNWDWLRGNPTASEILTSFYIKAGRAIIRLRQDDVKSLINNTFFINSSIQTLGPDLAIAIKNAGGDPSEHVQLKENFPPSFFNNPGEWIKQQQFRRQPKVQLVPFAQ